MSRGATYRSRPTEDVIRTMSEANESTFFLIQETGPTSFVLQNEREVKVRVRVGSTIHCSCGGGIKEHCVHTMFTLIKIFRVPPDNPLAWQLGFIDNEIDWLCKNRFNPYNKAKAKPVQHAEETAELKRISLTDEMCCAICQDDLRDDQILTYCKSGCGHNFHSRCMKVWADHKTTNGDKVTCPLCRCEFSLDFLRDLNKKTLEIKKKRVISNVHADTQCSLCRVTPITGERFHCVVCQMLDFCGKCYRLGSHQHHPFIMRKRPSDPWQPAEPVDPQQAQMLTRELSPHEFEAMRSLDASRSLHDFLASVLLMTDEGVCVFCQLDQRHIPRRQMRCGHACHEACLVDVMREENCNSCPVDGAQILPGLDSLNGTPCLIPPRVEQDFSVSGVQMNISQGNPKRLAGIRIRKVNTRSVMHERRPPLKPTQRKSVPASRYGSAASELSVVGRGAVSSAKSESARMQAFIMERIQ